MSETPRSFNDVMEIKDRMEYRQIYGNIINALGRSDVELCIPYTFNQLLRVYGRGDKYFNTLPVEKWKRAAGFIDIKGKESYVGSRLTALYWNKLKVNEFSSTDGVCILKECARLQVVEYLRRMCRPKRGRKKKRGVIK